VEVGSVHGSNDQKEKKKGETHVRGGIHATTVGRSGILGADPRSGYENGESRTCAQSVSCVSGHADDSVSTSTNHDLGLRKEKKGRNAGAYTPDDLLNAKFRLI
jgi:hypothetical protein